MAAKRNSNSPATKAKLYAVQMTCYVDFKNAYGPKMPVATHYGANVLVNTSLPRCSPPHIQRQSNAQLRVLKAAFRIQQHRLQLSDHLILEGQVKEETAMAGCRVHKHSGAATCLLKLCLCAERERLLTRGHGSLLQSRLAGRL